MKNLISIALFIFSIILGILGYFFTPNFLDEKSINVSEIKIVILLSFSALIFLFTFIGYRKNGQFNRFLLLILTLSVGFSVYSWFYSNNFSLFFPIALILMSGIILLGIANLLIKANSISK